MKINKFKQLTKKLNKLTEEIWKHEPPKPYIMFWTRNLPPIRQITVQRFYSKKDMLAAKDFIVGDCDPKNFTFYLTKEVTNHKFVEKK